jgi:hypothetical protein
MVLVKINIKCNTKVVTKTKILTKGKISRSLSIIFIREIFLLQITHSTINM